MTNFQRMTEGHHTWYLWTLLTGLNTQPDPLLTSHFSCPWVVIEMLSKQLTSQWYSQSNARLVVEKCVLCYAFARWHHNTSQRVLSSQEATDEPNLTLLASLSPMSIHLPIVFIPANFQIRCHVKSLGLNEH